MSEIDCDRVLLGLEPSGGRRGTIHDLRHTFASTAVASGRWLPMIGKLLGHTQVQTTARYAHLAVDPVKYAANQVSKTIAASMAGATAHRGHAHCVPAHPSEELRDCQPSCNIMLGHPMARLDPMPR